MLSHNVITLAPRQAATLLLESPVFAVTNPRISDLTRVDNDTPGTPDPLSGQRSGGRNDGYGRRFILPLDKQPYISAG